MAAQRQEKMAKETKARRPKVKEVKVDFSAIDEVRATVRKWRKRYLRRTQAGRKTRVLHSFSYAAAYFQVGRNSTYIRFVRINLPEPSVVRMAKELATTYPDYGIYYDHRDIYVYLVGVPYWERNKV